MWDEEGNQFGNNKEANRWFWPRLLVLVDANIFLSAIYCQRSNCKTYFSN
jgi:hypothetical protein